jgi:hypothetical protein
MRPHHDIRARQALAFDSKASLMAPSTSAAPALEIEKLFPGLRFYLCERFGPEAAAAVIERFPASRESVKSGGYGVPYLVSWQTPAGMRRLVLETVRPGDFGHEDRADRAAVVVRAADDGDALPRHVGGAGSGVFHPDGAVPLGDGEFFYLTEFCDGQPYARDLERILSSDRLDVLDLARAKALAEYLAGIHRAPVSHPTWYRRRLRDLTGAGECIAGIADSYPLPCGFIDASLLGRVESLALAWRYRLRDRGDRLREIHGDFHPWNILWRDGLDFSVLDRSRGRFGDPADDVAALSINYIFFALRSRGEFDGPFAALFRAFWRRYAEASGDTAVACAIAPHFAFRALVLAHPLWYPQETERTRRLLFRFLLSVLEEPGFRPDAIAAYLDRPEP